MKDMKRPWMLAGTARFKEGKGGSHDVNHDIGFEGVTWLSGRTRGRGSLRPCRGTDPEQDKARASCSVLMEIYTGPATRQL